MTKSYIRPNGTIKKLYKCITNRDRRYWCRECGKHFEASEMPCVHCGSGNVSAHVQPGERQMAKPQCKGGDTHITINMENVTVRSDEDVKLLAQEICNEIHRHGYKHD